MHNEYVEQTVMNDDESMEQYGYNYVGDDDVSVTTLASTVNSARKRTRKLLEDMKKIDKGYHKLSITANRLKKSVEVYSSSSAPGAMIRDAITGAKDPSFRVGSNDECQFFKVRYAALGCGSEGMTLFFDSPEQYERHMHSTVDVAIKSKWVDKCMEIRKRNKETD
jgi:hypothetical protein